MPSSVPDAQEAPARLDSLTLTTIFGSGALARSPCGIARDARSVAESESAVVSRVYARSFFCAPARPSGN